MKQWTTRRT